MDVQQETAVSPMRKYSDLGMVASADTSSIRNGVARKRAVSDFSYAPNFQHVMKNFVYLSPSESMRTSVDAVTLYRT